MVRHRNGGERGGEWVERVENQDLQSEKVESESWLTQKL